MKIRKNSEKRQNGFSLIELIIVIGIMFSLAAALLVVLSRAREMAKERAAHEEIHQLSVAIQVYTDYWGQCPPDNETMGLPSGSSALLTALESEEEEGPYATWSSDQKDGSGNLEDPWNRAYRYSYEGGPAIQGQGNEYNIWSRGKNDSSDPDDWIKNW